MLNLRDLIIRKLGGVPIDEWAAAELARKQLEQERNELGNNADGFEQIADTMRQRLRDNGFSVAADGSDPLASSAEWHRAEELNADYGHAMTLENTPAAFMNALLDYGTEAGDAPMVEDAGSDGIYNELLAHLKAHPQLRNSDRWRSFYEEVDRYEPDPYTAALVKPSAKRTPDDWAVLDDDRRACERADDEPDYADTDPDFFEVRGARGQEL